MAELLWAPDFCLTCARQIDDGTYCSPACRIADLDSSLAGYLQAAPSKASSTASTASTISTVSSPSSPSPTSTVSSSPSSSSSLAGSVAARLLPSASGSSLSSISSQPCSVLSDAAQLQLNAFRVSFDQSRQPRRPTR